MFNLDDIVTSTEHPNSIGKVIRIADDNLTIEWTTPPNENLPFGHIITEWWPKGDHHLLVNISARRAVQAMVDEMFHL